MQKIKKTLHILLVTISIILSTFFIVVDIYLYFPSLYTKLLSLVPFYTDNYTLLKSENQQKMSLEGLSIQQESLKYVPDELIDYMELNRWSIVITDKNIQEYINENWWTNHNYIEQTDTVGVTSVINREVVINAQQKEIIDYTTLHELAHVYDYWIYKEQGEKPQQTNEFIEIYNSEKDRVQQSAKSPQEEYFAHYLALYWFYGGENYKTQIEENTYRYLDNLLN